MHPDNTTPFKTSTVIGAISANPDVDTSSSSSDEGSTGNEDQTKCAVSPDVADEVDVSHWLYNSSSSVVHVAQCSRYRPFTCIYR